MVTIEGRRVPDRRESERHARVGNLNLKSKYLVWKAPGFFLHVAFAFFALLLLLSPAEVSSLVPKSSSQSNGALASTAQDESPCLLPSPSDLSSQRILPSSTSGYVPDAVPPAVQQNATLLFEMPKDFQLHVELTFKMRNPSSFQACLDAIQNPDSPYYQQFLNGTTLEPYSPTPGEISSIKAYLIAGGLTVTDGYSPLTLEASGTVGKFDSLFKVAENFYQENGYTFYAPCCELRMPGNYASLLGVIEGLDNYTQPHDLESPCSSPYCPEGVQVGYSISPLLSSGENGSGATVAVVDAPGDPDLQSAINTYDGQYSLAPTTLTVLYLGGVPSSYDPGWASEAAMDVEAVHTVAPGAHIVVLYQGPAIVDLEDLVDYAATNRVANVVSDSWVEGAPNGSLCSDTQLSSAFVQYVDERLALDSSQGLTMVFGSGDWGATPDGTNLGTMLPASDPNILAAGATNLVLSGCDATTCMGYLSENGSIISGGGYSGYFSEPSWQTSAIGTTSGRGVPDVSMFGLIPFFWVYSTASDLCGTSSETLAGWFPCAGTSLATPLWAGLVAILEQLTAGRALGNIAPLIWQLASSPSYAKDFHDVTSGNNDLYGTGGYSASAGWDLVTGWGSPVADQFVFDLMRILPFSANIQGPFPSTIDSGQSTNVTATVTWSGGTPPYTVTLYSGSSSSCASDTKVVEAIFGSNPATGLTGTTANFAFASPGSGIYYCATVTDSSGVIPSSPAGVASATVQFAVNPTSGYYLTASCNHDTLVVGSTVTCKATVRGSGSMPTGTVTWSSNSPGKFSHLGCKLSNGACSAKFTTASVGSPLVTVVASYHGPLSALSYRAAFALDVTQKASKTTVSCRSKSAVVDSTVTCKAKVKGYSPTGTVSWSQNDSAILSSLTCTLSHGTCSVTMTGTTAGRVTLQATYSGDPNNMVSSGTAKLTVKP